VHLSFLPQAITVKLILSHWYYPAARILLIFLIPVLPTGASKWGQCLSNLRNATWRESSGIFSGGTDNHGHPTPLTNVTTAVTYDLCKIACGSGPSSGVSWLTFLDQFGAWVLPWLALVSQLPFGANDKYENLIATLLTLGSPTLAAYSLALTVLNGRWVAKLFTTWNYHNSRNAARILNTLQQAPLKVTTDAALLASLVVLPENDKWWAELVEWLDFTHTWSISAAMSIVWVIIAYILAVIDSIVGGGAYSLHPSGQSIGSLWLWLLPIVAGWLQISPECDSKRLQNAINRANRIAYVATPSDGPELASSKSRYYAISLRSDHRDVLRRDEGCTVPIYNYARFLPWAQGVEIIAGAFCAASERVDHHISVDPKVEWVNPSNPYSLSHRNRTGTQAQVVKYCLLERESQGTHRTMWSSDVWSRMFTASVFALLLQWGTAGAAFLISLLTPTTGWSRKQFPRNHVLT